VPLVVITSVGKSQLPFCFKTTKVPGLVNFIETVQVSDSIPSGVKVAKSPEIEAIPFNVLVFPLTYVLVFPLTSPLGPCFRDTYISTCKL
jgi:hypothetical protein